MVSTAHFQEDLYQDFERCQVAVLHFPLLKCLKSLLRLGFLRFNLIYVYCLQPQLRGHPPPVQVEGDAGEVVIRTLLVKQAQGNAKFFIRSSSVGGSMIVGCSNVTEGACHNIP